MDDQHEDNVYSHEGREDEVANDEIDPKEEAFMEGYDQEDDEAFMEDLDEDDSDYESAFEEK